MKLLNIKLKIISAVQRIKNLISEAAITQVNIGRAADNLAELAKRKSDNEITLRNQRLAVTLKEKELAAKAKADRRASYIDTLRKSSATFAFAYGLLFVFLYCFLNINFFPSGMTTGDVLFFIFAALGLGLMALFGAITGSLLYLPATIYESSDIQQKNEKGWFVRDSAAPWMLSPVPILVIAAMLAFLIDWETVALFSYSTIFSFSVWLLILGGYIRFIKYVRSSDSISANKIDITDAALRGFLYLVVAPIFCAFLFILGTPGYSLLAALSVAGVSVSLALSLLNPISRQPLPAPAVENESNNVFSKAEDTEARELEQRSHRLKGAMVLFIISLVPALFITPLRSYVFNQLGVRGEGVAIAIDKVNLDILRTTADSAQIPLSICRGDDGNFVVSPVDILWHGMGARSLVQLRAAGNKDNLVNIEFHSSGLRVIRGQFERCTDIAEAGLFLSGSNKFITSNTKKLVQELDSEISAQLAILDQHWKIKTILVIGHADPMPLPGDGNSKLALERADAIKGLLLNSEVLSPWLAVDAKIIPSSAGARKPVKQCDITAPKDVQRECNEINRRVELRFRMTPVLSMQGVTTNLPK